MGRPGWGPDFSPQQLPRLPGALCLALSGVPQGSPHRPWAPLPFLLMWGHQAGRPYLCPRQKVRSTFGWMPEVCPSRKLAHSHSDQLRTGSEPPQEGGSVGRGGTPGTGTPWRWPFRGENSGQGQSGLLHCPTPDQPTCLTLSLPRSSLDPGPQQGDLLSLQCLKAGGTSVRHPATPSSLTAQGR